MIFEKINLEDDEQVLSVIRRHWFYVFKQCFFIFVLAVLPLIAYFILNSLSGDIRAILTLYTTHFIFLYSAWLLINWMMLAGIWTDHYLDIWCITNKRIIKIDQVTLFTRQTGSFRLERLQDLNVEIKGIIATILDYGTIHAQTASADVEEFKATYLPRPQEIKSLILKAADAQMSKNSL